MKQMSGTVFIVWRVAARMRERDLRIKAGYIRVGIFNSVKSVQLVQYVVSRNVQGGKVC